MQDRLLPNDFRDGVRVLHHSLTAVTNPDETTRQLARPMADEPLGRHYPRLRGPRARLARILHLPRHLLSPTPNPHTATRTRILTGPPSR